MTEKEIKDLLEWGSTINPINGLILAKAVWSGKHGFDLAPRIIIVPEHLKKKLNPFTLAIILNPGTGYRNNKSGEWRGNDFKPGDIIIAAQYVAYETEVDGRKVNYLPESKVLAMVDGLSYSGLFEMELSSSWKPGGTR